MTQKCYLLNSHYWRTALSQYPVEKLLSYGNLI
eukprot:CAMPEP_0116560082 /NCGR_PEP_ID=MMETSP0397-20121206/10772_1 /TAXON_ID=216820 /ORGANISM="Cyclophora tenuis, Strain ECT3854" /LENGTH=32 /DNA_ID= /DNA_START= /DNA_END= /DNA_ORIENTATION=